jgi:hypothetical protein
MILYEGVLMSREDYTRTKLLHGRLRYSMLKSQHKPKPSIIAISLVNYVSPSIISLRD